MYPILAHVDALGGPIRTYPVLIVVAALAGIAISIPRLRRLEGMDRGVLLRIILWTGVGAWLGGRLHHLANSGSFGLRQIFVEGRVAELFGASFHAGGAVIGLVVAAWIVTRHYRISLGSYGDAAVPGFGVGLAIGRFACFMNGCCTGTVCDYLWCVPFPKPTNVWNYHVYLQIVPGDAVWSAPVHPLQLYFTAAGLLIATAGYWLEQRKRYDGQVALIAILIFSASNAVLEQFRGFAPLRRYWFDVPQLTWVALAMMMGSVAALLYFELRHRRHRRMTLREITT